MAVKIQLKVKFPQAVITKIRTLSLVFPKLFRTSVRRETRDGYFWHYVCKTINLCSKISLFTVFALTVFSKMHSASSFMEIKMLAKKIFFQEICASWKQMLSLHKKPSFLWRNIYLYNLWYLAAVETLNTRGEVLYFK